MESLRADKIPKSFDPEITTGSLEEEYLRKRSLSA
jgi:hypothetical protein